MSAPPLRILDQCAIAAEVERNVDSELSQHRLFDRVSDAVRGVAGDDRDCLEVDAIARRDRQTDGETVVDIRPGNAVTRVAIDDHPHDATPPVTGGASAATSREYAHPQDRRRVRRKSHTTVRPAAAGGSPSRPTAWAASSSTGCSTVESAGMLYSAFEVPLKQMRAMSSGTWIPCSSAAARKPRACCSFAANTASGRADRLRMRAAVT